MLSSSPADAAAPASWSDSQPGSGGGGAQGGSVPGDAGLPPQTASELFGTNRRQRTRKSSASSGKKKRASEGMNGYILFSVRFRSTLLSQNPHTNNRDISRLLGRFWHSLPPHTKAEYAREAERMQLASTAAVVNSAGQSQAVDAGAGAVPQSHPSAAESSRSTPSAQRSHTSDEPSCRLKSGLSLMPVISKDRSAAPACAGAPGSKATQGVLDIYDAVTAHLRKSPTGPPLVAVNGITPGAALPMSHMGASLMSGTHGSTVPTVGDGGSSPYVSPICNLPQSRGGAILSPEVTGGATGDYRNQFPANGINYAPASESPFDSAAAPSSAPLSPPFLDLEWPLLERAAYAHRVGHRVGSAGACNEGGTSGEVTPIDLSQYCSWRLPVVLIPFEK